MMPKLDGISALKLMKQDAALRFIPVILLTAKADTADVVAGLEAGGDDYLTKPFDQAALIARVRSMLRIKGLHDTVQEQAGKLQQQTEPSSPNGTGRWKNGSPRRSRRSNGSAGCAGSSPRRSPK